MEAAAWFRALLVRGWGVVFWLVWIWGVFGLGAVTGIVIALWMCVLARELRPGSVAKR
jgi:hypothetical protein